MAQTIKLKRSGTQGAAPTTSNLALGEVAINTYDGKMYIKKDVGGTESIVEVGGVSSGSVSYLEAGMIEYEYTATSNQTTFSGSDSNSATLSYTANSVLVFLNGVLQDDGVDYTATNGTSVVFGSALTANDEVRIVAFTNVTTASSLQDPTKLDAISTVNNQAAYSLTLSSSAYTPSSQNALIVSLNGITQEPGDSFTISGSTITFSPALVTGDVVDYIVDMGRAVTIGEYSGDLAVGGELEVTGDIIGDLRGATLFNAQAGEALSKGDVVYISGISGNTTVVSKADANDAAKMPAFGIASAAANLNASVDIYTFGRLSGLDTSAFSEGDELFVSTTAGALTSTAPTGESSKLQKIAKVTRSHASAGSIFIMGAGRSNAVPNLDDGDIFIGNASNQAVSAALDTSIVPENGNLYFTTARVDSHLSGGTGVTYDAGEISIGQDVSTTATPTFGNITTTGYIAGPSTFTIDPAAVGDNTGTLVVAGNLQVDGTTTTINSTTMTVDDLNITLASGAANAAAANGAGITVDGASATLTYNGTNDDWNLNKTLNVTGDLSLVDSPFPRITLSDSDGTNQKTLIDQSGGFASLTAWNDSSHGTLDFKSYNNTTTRVNMRIDSSGNVGIGTANPDANLEIRKDNASGLGAVLSLTNGNTSGLTGNSVAIGLSGYAHTTIDSASYRGAIIRGETTAAGNGHSILFETSDTSATPVERVRIDHDGNVGIGTDTPSALLDVEASSPVIELRATTTTATTLGVKNNRILLTSNSVTGGAGGEIVFNTTDSTTGRWAAISGHIVENASGTAKGDIVFATKATAAATTLTERMRIDYNGNVGIGTASPARNLQVEGVDPIIASIISNTTGAGIGFQDGTTSADNVNTIRAIGNQLQLRADNNLSILTNSSERMRIDSAGNVIIKPSGKLYLESSSGFSPYLVEASNALTVNTNGSERMRIDGSGNVGIAGAPQSFGGGVTTLQLRGLSSSQPTRAGALRFISNNGTSCDTAIYSDNGFMSFYTGTSTSQSLNLQIDAYGGLNIKSVAGTQAATFGGSNLVNGITALPSSAGTPFVVGRDTGSLKSATFAGHVNINSGYGLSFDGGSNYLDDYEEGTYTPIYYGSASGNTGTTYTANTGVYTKVGRTVTVWIDMTITAQSGNSGVPCISLPFASGTGYGTDSAGQTRYDMGAFISWQTADNFTATSRPTGWITNNSGVMQMYRYTTAGAGPLSAWILNTTGRISGKIIYTAAF